MISKFVIYLVRFICLKSLYIHRFMCILSNFKVASFKDKDMYNRVCLERFGGDW